MKGFVLLVNSVSSWRGCSGVGAPAGKGARGRPLRGRPEGRKAGSPQKAPGSGVGLTTRGLPVISLPRNALSPTTHTHTRYIYKTLNPPKVEMWVGGLGERVGPGRTPQHTPCVVVCAERWQTLNPKP